MRSTIHLVVALTSVLLVTATANAQQLGTEEFGLTGKQLQQKIQQVEGLIAKCMQGKGFKYVPVDYLTVKRGMGADKNLPNMSEEEFVRRYGYGVATMYSGEPPQLTDGYSPARVGLGEENVRIFRSLSPQDQAAYSRALFGRNNGASFAVGLETENFSRCGGCTLEAIKQAFTPEQCSAAYYNPVDRKVNEHPLMKAALRKYRAEMQDAGFNFDHPDKCEPYIRTQLDQITEGGTLPVGRMTSQQRGALENLKTYELKLARINFALAEELFDPVEERVHKDLFPRKVQ